MNEWTVPSRIRRKRSGCGLVALILVLMSVCLVFVVGLIAYQFLPRWLEPQFGAPSPQLSSLNRMWYSIQVLANQHDLLTPAIPSRTAQTFEIGADESVNSISYRLEEAGLVRNAAAFRIYLIYAGLDTSIKAGSYEIIPSYNSVQIAQKIQSAISEYLTFVILPGWRAEEVALAIPAAGLQIDPVEFLALIRHPNELTLPAKLEGVGNLEGYLFPGEYRVRREISDRDLILQVLTQFEDAISADLLAAYKKNGLSLAQAVTLASMVQREAVVEEEQPIVASVFYNRLSIGMKLESDPTTQYALGFQKASNTWWKNPLSADDLHIQSPFNTYWTAGLPAGPICSPGFSALQAVAYPAKTPYYYFRARCDGSGRHNFAITFDEHVKNACP